MKKQTPKTTKLPIVKIVKIQWNMRMRAMSESREQYTDLAAKDDIKKKKPKKKKRRKKDN